MLYFEHLRQSKKLPKTGDTIWLIPIRYWEPEDYYPEKFVVERAYIQETQSSNKELVLYGQYENEEPDTPMYAAKSFDADWYWTFEAAREVQLLLTKISKILFKDDSDYYVDKILAEMESQRTEKPILYSIRKNRPNERNVQYGSLRGVYFNCNFRV